MPTYAALDVSMKTTSIHVVNEAGACLWRGKVSTDPKLIAELSQSMHRSLLSSVSKRAAGRRGCIMAWSISVSPSFAWMLAKQKLPCR